MPKLIHTYHGHIFHSYFSPLKTKIIIAIERFLARFTHTIIAVSESQKKELVETYRIAPAHKVRVIPNGFDLEQFLKLKPMLHDKKWKGKKNRVAVGIVGRLALVKNHELFFKFCDELSKHMAIEAHIIGDGERLEEISKMKHSNYLVRIWPVWIEHYKMFLAYEGLDIVVNSSKNEGTPAALIEAMAAGRLVVATPVGGNVDLIECHNFGRGWFLYEDNMSKTIDWLVRSIENGDYKRISARAREYVKKHHSLDRLVNDIEGLYNEVISDTSS
jgi:glycosyltransferase involved in cell wall biosynthesis